MRPPSADSVPTAVSICAFLLLTLVSFGHFLRFRCGDDLESVVKTAAVSARLRCLSSLDRPKSDTVSTTLLEFTINEFLQSTRSASVLRASSESRRLSCLYARDDDDDDRPTTMVRRCFFILSLDDALVVVNRARRTQKERERETLVSREIGGCSGGCWPRTIRCGPRSAACSDSPASAPSTRSRRPTTPTTTETRTRTRTTPGRPIATTSQASAASLPLSYVLL